MRFPKLFIFVGLAGLALAVLAAQDGALRVRAKVGDVRKLKLSAEFTTTAGVLKLSADVVRKVIKVDSDGSITVQESRHGIKYDLAGTQMSAPGVVFIRVVRPDGTTAELRGEEGTGPEAYRATTLTTVKLPNSPLALDKSWSWQVTADPKTGVVAATVKYKVVGEEKLHDIATWKITSTATENGGASPASSNNTIWISKADASLVKIESAVKNLPLKGVGPMSGNQALDMEG